jgi:putative tryptophan/tyrosine transport system substrate-binding protein
MEMGVRMRRREFITLLGAAAAEWSSRVQAQQQAIPVVGYLYLGSERTVEQYKEAFMSGFAARGYIEGKTFRLLSRFADGHTDRLAPLTTELVSLGARVILTAGGASIEAAHKAAPNVPIVSMIGPDPVMMGWAKSLAKPGGMITGLFFDSQSPKRFELLKELRPQATRFGLLMNAANPATPYMRKHSVDGVRTIGVELEVIELKELSELAAAFDRLSSLRVEGVAIAADPVFNSNPALFAELALAHKLPSVGDDRSFVKAGGLFTRTANYLAMAPRPARFVDEILKGAAPGDLAVELSMEYELTVNLKTARELGITIPPTVFAAATEVIE